MTPCGFSIHRPMSAHVADHLHARMGVPVHADGSVCVSPRCFLCQNMGAGGRGSTAGTASSSSPCRCWRDSSRGKRGEPNVMDPSTTVICPRVHCWYFALKYTLLNLCLNIYICVIWLSYGCCGNYNFLLSKRLLYVLLCCIIWRLAGNKIAAVNPSAWRAD